MNRQSTPVRDLGLMGGMFDPVHYGHLHTARNILDFLDLDEIHLLPCGNPVHRESVIATASQRLAMLELALADTPRILVDDRECRSADPSYTYNSLLAIRREKPASRLFYIMGQDAFNGLDTWFHWRDIFDIAHIVVAARPGYEPVLAPDLAGEFERRNVESVAELKQQACGKIFVSRLELLDISSSQVRQGIINNESISELLPPSVAAYIQANGLYTTEEKS